MTKNCPQKKCSYNNGINGCPICPECDAEPNRVCDNDMCVECWSCSNDTGYIRGGIPEHIKNEIKRLMKLSQGESAVVMKVEDKKEEKELVIER